MLCRIYFRSSTKTRMVKRIYQKITEYLANVSSILSSILVILFVISSLLNYEKARQSIINKILKFRDDMNFKKNDEIDYLKEKFSKDSKFKIKFNLIIN